MTVFSGFLLFLFLGHMSAELTGAVPDLSEAITKGKCLFYKSKKLTTHLILISMCFLFSRLITTRKRGLGQGNIFTSVCYSFCPQKGGGSASRGSASGGVCIWGGLHLGGWIDPLLHWILWDTANERAVRIILECILV